MILDKSLEMSLAQAFTAQGTTVSTNVIDLGSARNIGAGDDLYLFVRVDTAVTSLGAATVDIQLQTSANADLSSADVLLSTGAIAKATLVAGKTYKLKLPVGSYKRYLGVGYVVGTADLTAGKFDAWIAKDVDAHDQYPSGFSVL